MQQQRWLRLVLGLICLGGCHDMGTPGVDPADDVGIRDPDIVGDSGTPEDTEPQVDLPEPIDPQAEGCPITPEFAEATLNSMNGAFLNAAQGRVELARTEACETFLESYRSRNGNAWSAWQQYDELYARTPDTISHHHPSGILSEDGRRWYHEDLRSVLTQIDERFDFSPDARVQLNITVRSVHSVLNGTVFSFLLSYSPPGPADAPAELRYGQYLVWVQPNEDGVILWNPDDGELLEAMERPDNALDILWRHKTEPDNIASTLKVSRISLGQNGAEVRELFSRQISEPCPQDDEEYELPEEWIRDDDDANGGIFPICRDGTLGLMPPYGNQEQPSTVLLVHMDAGNLPNGRSTRIYPWIYMTWELPAEHGQDPRQIPLGNYTARKKSAEHKTLIVIDSRHVLTRAQARTRVHLLQSSRFCSCEGSNDPDCRVQEGTATCGPHRQARQPGYDLTTHRTLGFNSPWHVVEKGMFESASWDDEYGLVLAMSEQCDSQEPVTRYAIQIQQRNIRVTRPDLDTTSRFDTPPYIAAGHTQQLVDGCYQLPSDQESVWVMHRAVVSFQNDDGHMCVQWPSETMRISRTERDFDHLMSVAGELGEACLGTNFDRWELLRTELR